MSFSRLDWFDNVDSRPHPWPGLNWLTPMLYVSDVQTAVTFYENAFGFVTIFQLPEKDGTLNFARMRYRGTNFTISKEGSFEFDGVSPQQSNVTPPLTFYVYVDDVDQSMELALANGCKLLQAVRLEFWGDRKGRLRDPFGYIWELAMRIQ